MAQLSKLKKIMSILQAKEIKTDSSSMLDIVFTQSATWLSRNLNSAIYLPMVTSQYTQDLNALLQPSDLSKYHTLREGKDNNYKKKTN